jgi:hypothetical protein
VSREILSAGASAPGGVNTILIAFRKGDLAFSKQAGLNGF